MMHWISWSLGILQVIDHHLLFGCNLVRVLSGLDSFWKETQRYFNSSHLRNVSTLSIFLSYQCSFYRQIFRFCLPISSSRESYFSLRFLSYKYCDFFVHSYDNLIIGNQQWSNRALILPNLPILCLLLISKRYMYSEKSKWQTSLWQTDN